MGFFGAERKIAPEQIAISLHKIAHADLPNELIERVQCFNSLSQTLGPDRLSFEILCLAFFAVECGVTAALSQNSDLKEMRRAFVDILKTRIDFVRFTLRNAAYSKAVKNFAEGEVNCLVGSTFAKFCGVNDDSAIAIESELLFVTLARMAREVVEQSGILV